MVVQNVMKVIDVQRIHVRAETRAYLSQHIVYRDLFGTEHLMNIYTAAERIAEIAKGEQPADKISRADILSEIKRLAELAFQNDASYVRLIE